MHSLLGLLAAATTAIGVMAKPEQIRGVTSPIFHYYLQGYPQDQTIPVMGPEQSSEYFNIDTSAGSIRGSNSSAYLSIVGSDSTSYKTLTLSPAASAPGWGLEGDTIITGRSSAWGRQLNFLVCRMLAGGDYWQVYLQTGSEVPLGRTCSNYQSLHLPCLC